MPTPIPAASRRLRLPSTRAIRARAAGESSTGLVARRALLLALALWVGTAPWPPLSVWAQPSTYEGFGASTPGGSAGSVVHVTNLNDTGAGSLRTAVAQGNRTVVFDVGGTINLGSPLYVKGAFITIDGLTAPGPGITLRGDGLVIRGNQGAHDVIVRGLRVRDAPIDGIQLAYSTYNIVLDRVSVSGSGDGNIDITEDSHDVTVSWSILAAPASDKNMLIKYGGGRISLHNNLFGYSEQRNPTVSTDDAGTPATDTTVDIRNNLIWDWGFGTGILIFKGARANVVANYTSAPGRLPIDQAQGVVVCDHDCDGDLTALALAYVADNLSGDPLTLDMNAEGNVLDPFPAPPVTTQNAHAAAQSVLAQAGAWPRDSVDQQILASITLPPPLAGPNLSVSFLSVGTAGSALTLTDRTTNGSPHAADSSTTRFFLSVNPHLDATAIPVGSRDVGPLDAWASSVGSLTAPFPPGLAAGTYFLIAHADDGAAATETNEADNTTVRSVDIILPDLIVSTLSAPVAAAPGSSIAVSETTRNQSTVGAAISTTTRFYLSTDDVLDGADVVLDGSHTVPALAGGASSAKTTTLAIPPGTPGGAYFLLARADANDQLAELSEANNVTARALLVTGPDLVVQALTPPLAGVKPGARITISDTTANVGSAAPGSTTRYYLSTSAAGAAGDAMIGARTVPLLAAGAQNRGSASATIPASTAPGTYYVIARADGDHVVDEADETNNAVAHPIEIGIDLTVTTLGALPGATAGASFEVSDITKNKGVGTAPPSTTAFFLSRTAQLTADAMPIGSRDVPLLPGGSISSAITSVFIPSGVTGDFYIIALANVGAGIASPSAATWRQRWGGPMGGDTNNAKAKAIRVGPDLVVSALTGPLSARAGMPITVADTTTNSASVEAPSTMTRYYISRSAILDGQAVRIGERMVPLLPASHHNSQANAVPLPGGLAPGAYFIIAETNANCSALGPDNCTVLEYNAANNTRARAITIVP